MVGTKTLHKMAEKRLSELTKEDAAAYGINHCNVLEMIKKGDYLFPFFAQYDHRCPPSINDTFWLGHIKTMIKNGTLFMIYIPTSEWAFPDDKFDKNKKLLLDSDFLNIKDPSGFEDAYFETKEEVDLLQVYLTDKEVPNNIPSIKKSLFGLVEFGTQSIAKTAWALMNGYSLIRLPYEIKMEGLDPCFAIFHNTKPHNPFDI